jgi:Tfp pilus assembly protein FimV
MPVELRLQPAQAKLVFLALAYHLTRPGSELDPETRMPVQHGLAEVSSDLQPQLRQAVASITLSAHQLERLGSAILGAINELKVYPMLEPRPAEEGGGRRSSVPGFERTLRHLFPEVEEDPDAATTLIEPLMALKRRLDVALHQAAEEEPRQAPPRRRAWWQVWRGT